MNPVTAALACAGFSSLLAAQVIEIPAMTVLTSSVNMDNVGPAGPVTIAAIRAAGTNGGAPIASITLTDNLAADGLYNTNIEQGRGLGRHLTASGLHLIPPVNPNPPPPPPPVITDANRYQASDMVIDLDVRSTEFGLCVGDWTGGMDVEFRNRADDSLVASYSTSNFGEPAHPIFLSAPSSFDRVVLRADSDSGNWVLTELHVGTAPPWEPFGVGCPGTNGTPVLNIVTPPARGTLFTLSVTNMPPGGGVFGVALGFSITQSPTLGPLPIDLAPLGAPGCLLLVDLAIFEVLTHANGAGQWSVMIPNDPAFAGQFIANQGFVGDAPANAMGLIVTNGGAGNIQ